MTEFLPREAEFIDLHKPRIQFPSGTAGTVKIKESLVLFCGNTFLFLSSICPINFRDKNKPQKRWLLKYIKFGQFNSQIYGLRAASSFKEIILGFKTIQVFVQL